MNCVQHLLLTDPRCDQERIEANKDQLLQCSCFWVLEDPAFDQWWNHDDSQFLWTRGTMMTIALVAEGVKKAELW